MMLIIIRVMVVVVVGDVKLTTVIELGHFTPKLHATHMEVRTYLHSSYMHCVFRYILLVVDVDSGCTWIGTSR